MGTLLSIEVVRGAPADALDRAFGWFHEIEERCTRFNPASELMQLGARIGDSRMQAAMLIDGSMVALWQGLPDEAKALAIQAIDACKEIGHAYYEAVAPLIVAILRARVPETLRAAAGELAGNLESTRSRGRYTWSSST